jgi:H+-transporting ATPase
MIIVLSAALAKYADLAIVSAQLVVNAALSLGQERRAAGVVEALRRRLQVNARVRRESAWRIILARELVPGDIVRVRPGDIIPADVKLVTGALTIDQSALTGESKDADKAPGDVLPSGSIVRGGEGNGVVMLTGAKTYFGRTTELVRQARPTLHIEAVVAKVVRWLFVVVGVLLVVVIALSLVRGVPLLEMVPLMLVLMMSAVPVALPVMFTVSMAIGSRELAKRGVLVTRLSAAEDAATMDVLCVDKTGTITMNQLAVTGVIPLEHATEGDVLVAGALASQEANQDPIDLAILAAAQERHLFKNVPAVTPVTFAPFDAENRRTEAVVEQNGQRLRVMKGAVRTIAEACGLKLDTGDALARQRDRARRWIAEHPTRGRPESRRRSGRSRGGCPGRRGRVRSALYTFSFLLLLYFAVFSVVSARERRAFWSTQPRMLLGVALIADTFAGTARTRVGLPGLRPLSWPHTFATFAYAMVSCLIVNDAIKVLMIKWRVPTGVA